MVLNTNGIGSWRPGGVTASTVADKGKKNTIKATRAARTIARRVDAYSRLSSERVPKKPVLGSITYVDCCAGTWIMVDFSL
jgi:hypothetical protein